MAATGAVGKLQLGDHVCAFVDGVDGVDDSLELMARTVAAGLDAGDKVMVFTAALPPVALLAGLAARGVAIPPAERGGQVQVLSAREAYLPTGRFEPGRMLGRLALRAPAGVHFTAPQRAVERALDHLGVLQLSPTRLARAGTIDSPGTEMVA